MSGPSDRRFDLNLGEEAATPSTDNIRRPSFLSPTGPLTIGDSVMKNDMTAAVVARNILTPKDNRLLSKRSDELAVKDSLALNVQCTVISLKQEIRGLKHENKQLHRLAHDYATNMKRKLDQIEESDAPNDQPLMPLPSRVLSSTEAQSNHPPVPSLSGTLPTGETSPKQPL
ncbi:unnamed protein product [Malus baccata var. baccata]